MEKIIPPKIEYREPHGSCFIFEDTVEPCCLIFVPHDEYIWRTSMEGKPVCIAKCNSALMAANISYALRFLSNLRLNIAGLEGRDI